MDHPIDVHYDTSTTEGWPVMVFEVTREFVGSSQSEVHSFSLCLQIWDRSMEGLRGFCGCGSVWLPSTSGRHILDTTIWKPVTFDDGIIPDGKPSLLEMLMCNRGS